MNEYFDEINGKKHLTLDPFNESKENILENDKLCSKVIYLIRSITKSSDKYHEKYIKS